MQLALAEARFAEYVIETYDQLWREGGRMLSVGLHLRMIGRAGRIGGLERVLRHVQDRPLLAGPLPIVSRATTARVDGAGPCAQ